jgi:outer membrane lipoprotein-sorting protein
MKPFARFGCFLAVAAFLHAEEPMAQVFARMDTAAAHFKGMTADIQETVHTVIDDDNYVSNGVIKLRRLKPGDVRFLIDFVSPDPRSAAFTGEEMHVYNPKTNTEQIYDVATKKAIIEQAMLLGFGATGAEIKESYDVAWVAAENVDGQPAAHIKLTPKSKEMLAQVKQADLWISDSFGVPIQEKFQTTGSGDFNLFKYTHLNMTPGLSDNDLKLKTPKNVQKKRVGH